MTSSTLLLTMMPNFRYRLQITSNDVAKSCRRKWSSSRQFARRYVGCSSVNVVLLAESRIHCERRSIYLGESDRTIRPKFDFILVRRPVAVHLL